MSQDPVPASPATADRPSIEALGDPTRYRLILDVAHDALVPTVQALLKRASPVKWGYMLANLAVLAAMAWHWVRSASPIVTRLPDLAMGMSLGYLLLMPPHEAIHALAYRALGARQTQVVYQWRNLSAYCVADRFVVSGRSFVLVCLLPFLLINGVLIVTMLALGGFHPMLWGMLLLHTGACSGDFAFVNLVWFHRGQGLHTYDDVTGGRTRFYTTERTPLPTVLGTESPGRTPEPTP